MDNRKIKESKMIRIIAEKVKGKDLKAGELFSTANQSYWDSGVNKLSVGEKVYIRTNCPCPKNEENEEINRITIKRS